MLISVFAPSMPSTGSQSLAWLLAIVYGAAAPMETLAAAEEGNAGEGARLPGPARDPTIASSWRPAWRLPPLPWRPPPELSLPPSLMSPLIPSYCEQFNLNLYALVMGTCCQNLVKRGQLSLLYSISFDRRQMTFRSH